MDKIADGATQLLGIVGDPIRQVVVNASPIGMKPSGPISIDPADLAAVARVTAA